MAFAFLLQIVASYLLTDQSLMGGLYDHGTPGEFFLCSGFTFCWAFAIIVLSVLLTRRDSALSVVFPTLYSITAVLVIVSVCTDFQQRYDFYHDASFFLGRETQDAGH